MFDTKTIKLIINMKDREQMSFKQIHELLGGDYNSIRNAYHKAKEMARFTGNRELAINDTVKATNGRRYVVTDIDGETVTAMRLHDFGQMAKRDEIKFTLKEYNSGDYRNMNYPPVKIYKLTEEELERLK